MSRNTQISIKINNKKADDSVEKILPRLAEFRIEKLDLDLNYTNKSMFEAIQRYMQMAKENHSCMSLRLTIFDQLQFETILSQFDSNVCKSLELLLYCEAMINTRRLIYDFRCRNPFSTLSVKYIIEREETFTIKSLIKELLAAEEGIAEL